MGFKHFLNCDDFHFLEFSDLDKVTYVEKKFNKNPYLEECFDSAVVPPPLYMMVDATDQFHRIELGKVPRVKEQSSLAEAD